MRGKVTATVGIAVAPGITPACAGKRAPPPHGCRGWKDHPRVCGEKTPAPVLPLPPQGSPPRVRGKDRHTVCVGQQGGITPACAGKRPLQCHLRSAVRDHPRVCGEKVGSLQLFCNSPGSPPRVRGKGALDNRHLQGPGITPACAGKSQRTLAVQDEPQGSPPRVRGKVIAIFCPAHFGGITPACAGKSPLRT